MMSFFVAKILATGLLIEDFNHVREQFYYEELDLISCWGIPIDGLPLLDWGYDYKHACSVPYNNAEQARLALQYGIRVEVDNGELKSLIYIGSNNLAEQTIRLSSIATRLGCNCIVDAMPNCTFVLDDKLQRIHHHWCYVRIRGMDFSEITDKNLLYEAYYAAVVTDRIIIDRPERKRRWLGLMRVFLWDRYIDDGEFDDELVLSWRGDTLRSLALECPEPHIFSFSKADFNKKRSYYVSVIDVMLNGEALTSGSFVSPNILNKTLAVFGIFGSYMPMFLYYGYGGADPMIRDVAESRLLIIKRMLDGEVR